MHVCGTVRLGVVFIACFFSDESYSDASEDSASENMSPVDRSFAAFIILLIITFYSADCQHFSQLYLNKFS